tara:strand:+ start:494 stop:1612 length:1119 start_codon:yes stop_codon:yes gene_type:complete
MIHRRPGDERFFEIYQACVNKNPNNNMHFFGHGANNIDNIDRDLLTADKPNIIFSLDLSHHKTRQRIKKEVSEKQAELWWIGAEYDVFGDEAIKESWWGGEFFLLANEYINLPEITKEPSNKSPHWISLTLGPRHSRVYSSTCLMHYADLDKGEMRVKTHMAKPYNSLNDLVAKGCKWNTPPNTEMEATYAKVLTRPWWGTQRFLWQTYNQLGHCNNATNFEQYLRHLYRTTMVEIVNETAIADEETGNRAPVFLTEKITNSIHALNIPIVCGAKHTVKFLESMGFDCFRGHINHEYDDEEDSTIRIEKAIKDNMKILNDYNFAKKVWETNYNALKKNKDLLKSLLHNFANGKNIPMLDDINEFYLAKSTQI